MLFDLIALSYFDALSVALTFVVIIVVQLINSVLQPSSEAPSASAFSSGSALSTAPISAVAVAVAAAATTTTIGTEATANLSPPTSPIAKTTNGKFDKEFSIDGQPSPTLFANNNSSTNSSTASNQAQQNGFITHSSSFDTYSDEYHEDEDTLSLENLFPCDQSEIYASKKISFIIDEFIQTEENYVNNLRRGLDFYGQLADRGKELPEALQGAEQQLQLIGNIAEILELHERQILPLMLRNQHDLKSLFDELAQHFDKDNFYCYVIFTMGKKASMQLRQDNREWFQKYQTEINDKLGIDSFLVQPIQRLTRYPLLLQQFISEFYKSNINCKPVLSSVCKLDTRMRRLLDVVNQSEEISCIDEINELDVLEQGYFRRTVEFDAHHYPTRKKYRAKVFLFDRCLLCAEVRKKRLAYRHHYPWETLELQQPVPHGTGGSSSSNRSVLMLVKSGTTNTPSKEEYNFTTSEGAVIKLWLRTTHKIMETVRLEASQRGKVTLPMDLVLGVALAIWLIWQYL